MRRILLLFALLSALAACGGEPLAPTAPSPTLALNGAVRTDLSEPINTATFTVFNPCTNENIINAVGTGHLTRIELVTPNGKTIIRGSIVFEDVVGVGETSGQTYELKNRTRFKQDFEVDEGGTFEQRVRFEADLDTEGPDLMLTSLLVIDFPVGLAPVVRVRESEATCK